MGIERILELSRDPLFKAVYPDRTDWVQVGSPIEPFGRHAGHASFERTHFIEAMTRLSVRAYDFAVFPAIRNWVPADENQPYRALLRKSLVWTASRRVPRSLTGAVFGLEQLPFILRDVSDFPDLDESGSKLFPGAALYSKREVLEEDLHSVSTPPLVYTPMPLELEPYDSVGPVEKKVDVFYAARLNSDLRREAHRVLEALSQGGVTVDMPEERLDFAAYLRRMSAARLVVSPRGQGEHCYRHYEALLLGSVPVINRPLRPVHYELQHQETCLFYEPGPDGLRQQIFDALSDPAVLAEIAERGSELVRANHSKQSICMELMYRAEVDPPEQA